MTYVERLVDNIPVNPDILVSVIRVVFFPSGRRQASALSHDLITANRMGIENVHNQSQSVSALEVVRLSW